MKKYKFVYRLCQVAFAIIVILTRPALAQVQPTAISLEEYKIRLETATQTLQREADASTKLATVQKELASIKTVRLPSGQLVTLQPLLGAEANELPAQDMALIRIQLVLDQLKAAANDNTAARLLLLDQVLAQPEFNTPLSLWERLLRWLRSFLPASPSDATSSGAQAISRVMTWMIAGVGGILLAFLLSYWLQGVLGSFVADFEARRRAGSGEDVPLTASAARQQATELARAGNYRNAVRQLYLSALLSLEEHNLIIYDRSLTNREVLAQIRNRPTLQSHLEPVVETFDNVWYGFHEPDQTTFTSYAQQIDQLAENAQDSRSDKAKG